MISPVRDLHRVASAQTKSSAVAAAQESAVVERTPAVDSSTRVPRPRRVDASSDRRKARMVASAHIRSLKATNLSPSSPPKSPHKKSMRKEPVDHELSSSGKGDVDSAPKETSTELVQPQSPTQCPSEDETQEVEPLELETPTESGKVRRKVPMVWSGAKNWLGRRRGGEDSTESAPFTERDEDDDQVALIAPHNDFPKESTEPTPLTPLVAKSRRLSLGPVTEPDEPRVQEGSASESTNDQRSSAVVAFERPSEPQLSVPLTHPSSLRSASDRPERFVPSSPKVSKSRRSSLGSASEHSPRRVTKVRMVASPLLNDVSLDSRSEHVPRAAPVIGSRSTSNRPDHFVPSSPKVPKSRRSSLGSASEHSPRRVTKVRMVPSPLLNGISLDSRSEHVPRAATVMTNDTKPVDTDSPCPHASVEPSKAKARVISSQSPRKMAATHALRRQLHSSASPMRKSRITSSRGGPAPLDSRSEHVASIVRRDMEVPTATARVISAAPTCSSMSTAPSITLPMAPMTPETSLLPSVSEHSPRRKVDASRTRRRFSAMDVTAATVAPSSGATSLSSRAIPLDTKSEHVPSHVRSRRTSLDNSKTMAIAA